MLAKAIGLASSLASPEGTSNCLVTIWTGQVFPLWILAQSLCVLPLQVFWDEIGVWRPLRGWLLTFLAKGSCAIGRVLSILGKNGKKDDNGDDGKSQPVTQPSGPREVTSLGRLPSLPLIQRITHSLLVCLCCLCFPLPGRNGQSALPVPAPRRPLTHSHQAHGGSAENAALWVSSCVKVMRLVF